MKNPITFSQFLNSVGRKRFEDALGISTQLITRALKDGLMPSHWFLEVRDWCVANQIDVPEHLFRMRLNTSFKQNANSEPSFQDKSTKIVNEAQQ